MNTENINTSIPIMFQKLNQYEVNDDRFLKVKIWLMHVNENLNGSFFDKAIVETAIPSLANTPILIYIEDNSNGEKDASDHRQVLVREDGQYKIKYIGQAIGTIGETNNAQFEKRVCDDGIEREFLTVEGLMWTKFDDPIDIMNRDICKAESMEIDKNYTGAFAEDGYYHFSDFKFYGACILGKDVMPAMQNASIELQFSYDEFHKEIQEKMEQFKNFTLQNQSSEEVDIKNNDQLGGNIVDEKVKILEKYNLTSESLNFSIDELSVEELEGKIQEHFSLLASQKQEEICNCLREEKYVDRWGDEYSKYSYVEHNDNEVFAYDKQDCWNLYGFTYSMNGDKCVIDFSTKKRKKFQIVDFVDGEAMMYSLFPQEAIDYEVKSKEKEVETKTSEEFEALKIKNAENETTITTLTEQFTNLQDENQKLAEYKSTKEIEIQTEAMNELFSDFEDNLKDCEKYSLLKEDINKDIMNYNVENVRKDLLSILGELNFSKTTKKTKVEKVFATVIETEDKTQTSRYGKYEKFMEPKE